jgi:predicted metal-binding protein
VFAGGGAQPGNALILRLRLRLRLRLHWRCATGAAAFGMRLCPSVACTACPLPPCSMKAMEIMT